MNATFTGYDKAGNILFKYPDLAVPKLDLVPAMIREFFTAHPYTKRVEMLLNIP